MEKRKGIFVLLAMAVIMLSLTGCGRRYMMTRPNMHLLPVVSKEALPEKVTVATFAVNPVMDLAEGGDGRMAWQAMIWDMQGNEIKLLALNLAQFISEKYFLIVIPKSISEIEGSRLAVFDHGGKRVYNHRGEYRPLSSGLISGKIQLEKFRNFLPEIKSGESWIREITSDSEEFNNLTKLFTNFRVRELKAARDYVYRKYGSNLSEIELNRIAKEDSIITGFIDWLGRDWKVFLTYPFTGIEATAISVGVVKIFTLPSIWGEKIKKPGYMEYIGDSEHNAKMILRGIQDYGRDGISQPQRPPIPPTASPSGTKLPENLRQQIYLKTEKDFTTYEEYNSWVVESWKKQ